MSYDDAHLTPKDWHEVRKGETTPGTPVALEVNGDLWRWWRRTSPADATAYVVEMVDGSHTLLADLPPKHLFLLSELN